MKLSMFTKPLSEMTYSQQFDSVNRPMHYASGGVECIEAMEASMSPEAFRGFLKGNVLKYAWRYEKKNGLEDLRKAKWYLETLILALEADEERDALEAIQSNVANDGCKDGFCPMPNVRYDQPPTFFKPVE